MRLNRPSSFLLIGYCAYIRPVTKKVDDVFGRLYKPDRKPVSVEEMDEKIKQIMRATT